MDDILEQLLLNLTQNGSKWNVEILKKIKEDIITLIKKDQGLKDCLLELTENLKEYSASFIDRSEKVISGLSSMIYLQSSNGSNTITVYGGKTRYHNGVEISEKTIFDLASITKTYTFLLGIILIENGYLKWEDKIKELDSRFCFLDDYTVNDIFKMSGSIKTEGRVTDGKTNKESLHILETTYIENSSRSFNQYTDLGLIILSQVIEKVVSQKLKKQMTFEEIMNVYLLKPWGIEETMFHPNSEKFDIAGNGNLNGLVHDPKARILGGTLGSAGLFTTSNGMKSLARNLCSIRYQKYSRLAGTIIYPHAKKNYRGYVGIYQKHPLGLDQTFVPNEYGNGSFAPQGFTGQIAVFDPKNRIHNHILVNSIPVGEAKKPEEYLKAAKIFQIAQVETTLKAYLLKRYYEKNGYFDQVEIKAKVKKL